MPHKQEMIPIARRMLSNALHLDLETAGPQSLGQERLLPLTTVPPGFSLRHTAASPDH